MKPGDGASCALSLGLPNGEMFTHDREFEGPHGVPAEITEEALDWFLAGSGGKVRSAAPA